MKRCAACRQSKPLRDFYSAKNRSDGRYNYCRKCALAKARIDYQKHRLARIRAAAKYRHDHADERRAYNKARYWANRDKELSHAKAWARNNRQRRREYVRKWNAANRAKVRSYQENYKARRRGATSQTEFTAESWRLSQLVFRDRCVYCGKHKKLEQDHLKSLKRGGEHRFANIVPACRHCNATKFSNDPPKFWWK
jgi:5-methylcytosine-specific restriction endonuclease McrA